MHHIIHIIHIEPLAPPKPTEGAACNGCGVCCLVEPCPIGMLVSRRRRGRCDALVWSGAERRYLCGMLTEGERHTGRLGRWMQGPVRRWIAAGRGCDSNLQANSAQPMASRERA